MRLTVVTLCLLALPLLSVALASTAPDPHRARRDRLVAALGDGVLLVRGAAASGAVNENFRYLTGIGDPRGALLIVPRGVRVETGRRYPGRNYVRGRTVRQVLFLPARDALAATWGEDSAATAESASASALGVDAIYPASELPDVLGRALKDATTLHVVRSAEPTLTGAPDPDVAFVDDVRRRFFHVDVEDATAAVHRMRRTKSEAEIEAMGRAIDVTREALERVLAALRPGIKEQEIEAEILHVTRSRGATLAFETIVASGPNANLAHYRENTRTVEAGELVLIDTGASVDGYKSDVTRTYPVEGRFTPRQREVYEVVLRAQQAAIDAAKPGALVEDLHAAAWDVVEAAGYGRFFYHGTSHYLGLETHDMGDYYERLEPGAVVTVEPGIYIPEEAMGIRIEDDVLITPGGNRVLTSSIPKAPDDVEAALARARGKAMAGR